MKRTSRAQSGGTRSADDSRRVRAGLLEGLVGMLLVARLLVPTEAAAQGNTLWLVQLWLAVALLWAWFRWREGDFRLRFDRLDVWLWVLVGGHVLSALVIVATEGQKRTAINMLWEWVGLGVAFFLIRQVLQTTADARRLVLVMVSTATVLAGLGLWQHYVFYPQAAGAYQQQRSELDRLLSAPIPAVSGEAFRRQQRIREIRSEFARQQIPLEGPGRELFEQRLGASSEPFGTFALPNTFAGLLVAWLIVAAGLLVGGGERRPSWRERVGPAAAVALMGFCLVLTKSRTAMVGMLVGLMIWGGREAIRIGVRRIRVPWKWVLAGSVVLAAAVTAASISGGLDRQVLTEAPKSLRYRLQYWTATWEVIEDHPIWGTGPGNFRQHYLRHKLPESSEEIAEPHNILLDVWTSGGLVGVIGLLGLLGAAWRMFRNLQGGAASREAPTVAAFQPLTVGAGCGFLVVFAGGGLLEGGLDLRLPILGAAWIVIIGLLRKASNRTAACNVCLEAAFWAILVHLLGAGGIEMPAIVQTLLVLLALGWVRSSSGPDAASRSSRLGVIGCGSLLLVLFGLCFLTGTRPVLNHDALLSAGERALVSHRNVETALRRYRQAAEQDPLSPEPLGRMAELLYRRWERSSNGGGDVFARAVKLQRLANAKDPESPHGYRRLGNWYLRRFARTGDAEDAAAAVRQLRKAARHYPTNVALRAELAEALSQAGRTEESAAEATRALTLEQINRREGHRDQYLPPETVQTLNELVEQGDSSPGAETGIAPAGESTIE